MMRFFPVLRRTPAKVTAIFLCGGAATVTYSLGLSYYGFWAVPALATLLLVTWPLAGGRSFLAAGLTALVLLVAFGFSLGTEPLRWEDAASTSPEPWLQVHHPGEEAPIRMREEYALAQIVSGRPSQLEAVLALAGWVNGLWSHSGSNTPSDSHPFTILEEARAGARFRCVEYTTIMVAAAQSLDIPARSVGLKTKRAAGARSGAGHIVAEVWLSDLEKWVMVDPQQAYIPTLDGLPISAVELQQALVEQPWSVAILSLSGPVSRAAAFRYLTWVAPYLYHFDTAGDQRVFENPEDRFGGTRMLLPFGGEELRVFQRRFPLQGYTYTSQLELFYAPPVTPGDEAFDQRA